jgi:CubicO group peptidase (beta-lactamase class C family)
MKRRDFAIGIGASAVAAGWLRAQTAANAAGGASPSDPDNAWTAAQNLPALGTTDAFLIQQHGKITFERYGADHGPQTPHISWSMAKSITHALAGLAVKAGKVDIDTPLTLAPRPDPKLNLRALLTLTDGLDWHEANYGLIDSDATKMLYGEGRFDGAAFTIAKAQAVPPGTRWNYSTGAFQLAAAEIAHRLFPEAKTPETKRAAMRDWMNAALFQPLGMSTAQAEFDAAGTFIGGSLVYASARDFAKFGELYRLDGVWNGQRLLPQGWVDFARTPTRSPNYGAGFWLESAQKDPAGRWSLMAGKGPADAFSAQGHAGQVIVVIPSKAAVVVRLGLMPDGQEHWLALGRWLAPILNALPDSKA